VIDKIDMRKAFIEMDIRETMKKVSAFYVEYNKWLDKMAHQQTDFYRWGQRKAGKL